jgi:hypothetical protein
LAGLLFISIFTDDITVSLQAPETVVAGQEFTVELTLDKGDLASFSRLMQELPEGLTAKPVNSSSSDFSFKDQKVRFIWLKMPESQKVTVSYVISVDQRLKGTFDLGGKFSFIANNERQSVEIQSKSITINPSPDIDPSLVVDIKDFKNSVIPNLKPNIDNMVFCVRQKPEVDAERNEIVVNILVNKEDKQKFAKIEEKIPEGYTAVNVDSRDGIFKVEDNTVKFLWMNMPSDPYFVVTYKLVPVDGVVADNIKLKGLFSYVNDDKTFTRDIVEQNVKLRNITKDQLVDVAAKLPADYSKGEGTTVTPAEDQKNLAQKDEKEPKEGEEQGETTHKTKPAKSYSGSANYAAALNDIEKSNRLFVLEPEDGVYFRVQVAAGRRPVDVKHYFKRLKLNEEDIRIEKHDGWNKYSIGSFLSYRDARDYRVHIWNTTPIGDAFVSAYCSGKRITVQEALMISNQNWYK